MSELSPEARAMLAEYRRAGALSADARARVSAALARSLASEAPPARDVGSKLGRAKLVSAAVVIGFATLGGWRIGTHSGTRQPPSTAFAPALAAVEPPAAPAQNLAAPPPAKNVVEVASATQPLPRALPVVARKSKPQPAPPIERPDYEAPTRVAETLDTPELPPSSPVPVQPPTAPPVRERPPPAPSIDGELDLLQNASAALRAGDPQRALIHLAEHRWRYPLGKLADSRDVTRMLALCANGDTAASRAEAARFLAAHPHSPFAARVRSICVGERTSQ